MKKRSAKNSIQSEVLAAYLDGNATMQESQEILDALCSDAELREIMHISQMVDLDISVRPEDIDYIPMTAMAACSEVACSACCNEMAQPKGNLCSFECEKFILKKLDIEFDEDELLNHALQCGWLKDDGTALHNIGRGLEKMGLVVTRQYKCTIADIMHAKSNGEEVIVALDGGELLGNQQYEEWEDNFVGKNPDHSVVVLSWNIDDMTISVFDPNSLNEIDTYSFEQFEDAWNDSKNYMVTAGVRGKKEYLPKPIDLSDVELPNDLIELREAIAENAHDVWAVERQAQGWVYGEERNDDKKTHPCMVYYSELPESEKRFDREMAMNTLKLLRKLGYDIIKRKN